MDHRFPIVRENDSIKESMRVIDNYGLQLALVEDSENSSIIGLITDGDIRRAILEGASLNEHVKNYMKSDFIYVDSNTPEKEIYNRLIDHRISHIPQLDSKLEIEEIHSFHSLGKILSSNLEPKRMNKHVKRVLVIGGAGYVGHHIIDLLSEHGYKIRCLDLNLYQSSSNQFHSAYRKDVEFVQGDMRSIPILIRSIENIDAVIHLGAIVGDPASEENPELAITSNFLSASLIALTCKYFQINRFVFISTCSVYGRNEKLLVETDNLDPVSLYGRNKVDAEKAILSLSDFNFQPTILRFGTIFGTSGRMRFDLVINLLTANAIKHGLISIYGGDQWRPLIHVRDAASAVIKTLETPLSIVGNQIYNVGTNRQNLQIKQLIPIFKNIFPDLKVDRIASDKDIRDYKVDFSKISRELNFVCKISIEESIEEIKNFILENELDYTNSVFSNAKFLKEISTEF